MSLQHFHDATARWFADAIGDAHSGATCWLGGHPSGAPHAHRGADRIGQDARGVPDRARRPAAREGSRAARCADAVRVVYVSPLKALSADIHKNLAEPRAGDPAARRSAGLAVPRITAAVRTGDTTASERAAMLRTPPHILVTTPESLYLLLTARAQPRDAPHRADGDRRRNPRGDRHAPRRAPRAVARAAPAGRRTAAPAHRPLGDAEADRRGRAVPGRQRSRRPTARSWTTGIGATWISASRCRTRRSTRSCRTRCGRSSTTGSPSWSSEHRTTLVSSTRGGWPSGSRAILSERLGEEAVTAHHGSLSKETAARRRSIG